LCIVVVLQRSGSLIFMQITSTDSGTYTCEAVNEALNVGETGSLYRVQVNASGSLHCSEIKMLAYYFPHAGRLNRVFHSCN